MSAFVRRVSFGMLSAARRAMSVFGRVPDRLGHGGHRDELVLRTEFGGDEREMPCTPQQGTSRGNSVAWRGASQIGGGEGVREGFLVGCQRRHDGEVSGNVEQCVDRAAVKNAR